MENSTITMGYEEFKKILTQSIQYQLEAKYIEELKDRDLQIEALTEELAKTKDESSNYWWQYYKADKELKQYKDYIESRCLAGSFEEFLDELKKSA